MSNKNKNSLGEEIDDAIEDVKEYINLRLRLIQLNIAEKIATALSNILSSALALLFIVLFFIFGSFALSYWLATVLGSNAAGFGAIAGFYLFIAILLITVGKNKIRKKFIRSFIDQFSNDDDD